jgi:hypothetical protein
VVRCYSASCANQHVFKSAGSPTPRRGVQFTHKRTAPRRLLRHPIDLRPNCANKQLPRHQSRFGVPPCFVFVLFGSAYFVADGTTVAGLFQPLLPVWKYQSAVCDGLLVRYLNVRKVSFRGKQADRVFSLHFKFTVVPLHCRFQRKLPSFDSWNRSINFCANLHS